MNSELNSELTVQLSMTETCQAAEVSTDWLIEIVEHGIVEPRGISPSDWAFDIHMLTMVRRASRLYRDLEIDWQATALVLDLLEERENLERENRILRQRLKRFLL